MQRALAGIVGTFFLMSECKLSLAISFGSVGNSRFIRVAVSWRKGEGDGDQERIPLEEVEEEAD